MEEYWLPVVGVHSTDIVTLRENGNITVEGDYPLGKWALYRVVRPISPRWNILLPLAEFEYDDE